MIGRVAKAELIVNCLLAAQENAWETISYVKRLSIIRLIA
jgi:hypothetical protein